ncbi:60 kDa jasmonate-induced protein-like isoform X2 [Chenopodium quinoa]|nr:60 kDa jasmonate-induced protein-like isoform X2 [Chenopodium quinoa]
MIKFNISTDNYMTFIQQVRDWAKDPNRFSHGCPVLPHPPPTMKEAQYMDIELRAKDAKQIERVLTVKIRRHDLYIIGYRMDGATNWLEFKWDTTNLKLIPHSVSLGFGENYDNLGKLENLEKVGYSTLKQTIIDLALTTDSKTRKSSLRALAVMISETVRFQKLSDTFAPVMQALKDIKFDETWMEPLIKNWGDLSDMLLREDQFAIYFRLPRDKETNQPNILTRTKELGIVTSADAAKCISVLKGNYPTRKLQLMGIPAAANSGNSIQGKGLPLLQVFSVHINNIAGEIYGTIQVDDGLGTLHLYKRQRTDYESIKTNEALTLTGPYRCTSVSQYFKVSLDLKKRGNNPTSDVEVSNDLFSWDICQLSNDDYYDKRLSNVVNGRSGSATVYYTPFRDAVQANVEVVLINGDGKNPAEVYGSLVARYSNYIFSTGDEQAKYQSTLFNKPSKEFVKVNPGTPIPLSRAVISVPTTGSLITEANIFVSSNKEISKGTAEFPPQLDGKTVKAIKGKFGLVRVTVAWKAQISDD